MKNYNVIRKKLYPLVMLLAVLKGVYIHSMDIPILKPAFNKQKVKLRVHKKIEDVALNMLKAHNQISGFDIRFFDPYQPTNEFLSSCKIYPIKPLPDTFLADPLNDTHFKQLLNNSLFNPMGKNAKKKLRNIIATIYCLNNYIEKRKIIEIKNCPNSLTIFLQENESLLETYASLLKLSPILTYNLRKEVHFSC